MGYDRYARIGSILMLKDMNDPYNHRTEDGSRARDDLIRFFDRQTGCVIR